MTSLKRVALACALGAALGLGYSAPAVHDAPGAAKGGKPSGAASAKRKARKNRNKQRGDAELIFIVILVVILGVIIGLTIGRAKREQREWRAFAAAHHCKVVGRKNAQVMPTTSYTSDGKAVFGTTVIPSQVAYLCDDGVTYWR